MNTFSIKESIAFGWRTFNERRAFYIGAAALVFVVSILADMVDNALHKPEMVILSILAVVLSFVVSTFLGMGQTNFSLRAHDAPKEVKFKDLWAPKPFWTYLAVSVLGALIVIGGLILLIVPGIIFGLAIMFSGYIVMDQGRGPITALKESVRITKGSRWKLFGFSLAMIGINILGLLALVVGLLVSIPVSYLATVYVYRTLQRASVSADA